MHGNTMAKLEVLCLSKSDLNKKQKLKLHCKISYKRRVQ